MSTRTTVALLPPLLMVVVLTAACGMRKPIVYNDQHYQEVGAEQAKKDVDECMEIAKANVGTGSGQAGKTAVGAATGTVVGAASGAAGGAIWGNAGRGAASGAVAGLVGGLLFGIVGKKEPDPVYKNYVDACLQQRGYGVAGWR